MRSPVATDGLTHIIGDKVVVRRKADGVVGTLRYQNDPRLYYGFEPTKADE